MFLSSAEKKLRKFDKLVQALLAVITVSSVAGCTPSAVAPQRPGLHEVSDRSFQDEVLDAPHPVLVEFYTSTCTSCEEVEALLATTAERNSAVKLVRVNAESNPATAKRYRNRAVPHLILFNNGDVVDEMLGVPSQARLDAAIKRLHS